MNPLDRNVNQNCSFFTFFCAIIRGFGELYFQNRSLSIITLCKGCRDKNVETNFLDLVVSLNLFIFIAGDRVPVPR